MSRPKLPRARPRMSEAQFLAYKERVANGGLSAIVLKADKGSKYRNVKCVHDGMTFDSKRELRHWLQLCRRRDIGEIRDLKRQVPFILAAKVDLGEKRAKPAMRYVADFVYIDVATGKRVVADSKGLQTQSYRDRKHLMATVHQIIVVEM